MFKIDWWYPEEKAKRSIKQKTAALLLTSIPMMESTEGICITMGDPLQMLFAIIP